MAALAAVSAQELLATYDCSTWACTGAAAKRGGLCSYCRRHVVVERPRLELALEYAAAERRARGPGRMERAHRRVACGLAAT